MLRMSDSTYGPTTMNPNYGPLSPTSTGSNDSSFASRYNNLGPAIMGTPGDVPYSGGPYGAARPQPRASPPSSGHPSSSTDVSRPSASGSSQRPPSSASSVGGRSAFGPPGANHRDSARSLFRPDHEDVLQKHYYALRGYLAAHLRDEKGNMKPNRARDKLLRLSVTQFMELSTDVFDELVRREDDRLQRVRDVPRCLLPKPSFHPKRNQARQKLSTLPVERFRQLATDVFFELERRVPRFAGQDLDRPMSSSSRAPSRGGMYPPTAGFRGPPSSGRPSISSNGMAPPNPPYQNFRPNSPGFHSPTGSRSRQPSDASSIGRPLPKAFQGGTVVPNKSTMVEDFEGEDEDEFALDRVAPSMGNGRFSEATSASNEKDRDTIRNQEAEIAQLKEHLEALEARLQDREQELEGVRSSGAERANGLEAERGEWLELRDELEQKAAHASQLNDSMRSELDALRLDKTESERDLHEQHHHNLQSLRERVDDADGETRDLRDQNHDLRHRLDDADSETSNLRDQNDDLRHRLDDAGGETSNLRDQNDDLRHQLETQHAEIQELRLQADSRNPADNEHQSRRIHLLEEELATQEKLTKEVRDEAMMYLHEMRDLSRQNDEAVEQEEKLAAQVTALGREIDEWRQRYARVKAQNRSLRASTIGLNLHTAFDAGSLMRKEGLMSPDGLVRDVDVTHFQLSVDELLRAARKPGAQAMIDSVKQVTVCVQSIAANIDTDGHAPHSPNGAGTGATAQPDHSVAKLKARVMGTANSLITATKQHATAHGLSPVALLDAAASNLTAAVVELVKAVGIRVSSDGELGETADRDSYYSDQPSDEVEDEHHHGARHAEAVQVAPSHKPGAALSVGRSNTMKKGTGWFNWGRNTDPDEPFVPEGAANGGTHPAGKEVYEPFI